MRILSHTSFFATKLGSTGLQYRRGGATKSTEIYS